MGLKKQVPAPGFHPGAPNGDITTSPTIACIISTTITSTATTSTATTTTTTTATTSAIIRFPATITRIVLLALLYNISRTSNSLCYFY